MTCTDFLARLTDFFDGTVPSELVAEVEKHIAECKHYKVVLDSTTKTINIYRNQEFYDFSPELEERLHTTIMTRCYGAERVKQTSK